ncbi:MULTISPECIES: siderophore-interacting protein [unclassified Streptomyces]|uniref:siderophore-interacting protein n=1 Tax=unclassified Streptomyces TaxID=2593676 RepID=UPI002474CF11|nr:MULTISPECIES: siderophore-interacting protein [unclassified Streptomyces]MDH6450382.1 NADPH-dependent ferric siderophore reductase [Streptomyces sp. SAI-119]MDH6499074.1 NADPH-dependent ferric siderophore reductase [Streptomyces sp. SAI-149]
MTTAVAAPFRFFSLQVARTRRLGPPLVRVSFTGEDLQHFFSHGHDQSLSLFLPAEGRTEPGVPVELGDGWWQAWRETPDAERAVMRSYTLRGLRRDPDEIDIDFVLHEPAGPASRWAARACAGDRVQLLGPAVADNRAIRFRPPTDTDLVVLWGDETALPAVSAILEALPAGQRARVWLEVHDAGDIQDLATEADAEITWLVAEKDGAESSPMALGALRDTPLPPAERPYVWIAGESGCVKELRRHFVRERGVDRRRVTFVGYWRQGMTEEQLRAAE